MKRRSNAGKWVVIGMSFSDRNKMYRRLRIKAYNLLKNEHEEEYKRIIKRLLEEEKIKYKNDLLDCPTINEKDVEGIKALPDETIIPTEKPILYECQRCGKTIKSFYKNQIIQQAKAHEESCLGKSFEECAK